MVVVERRIAYIRMHLDEWGRREVMSTRRTRSVIEVTSHGEA